LKLSADGATLRIYDATPDAEQRIYPAEHPFPITEPALPLREEFQRPISVQLSWLGLAANFFRAALSNQLPAWITTML
jgi:hypothetical protein